MISAFLCPVIGDLDKVQRRIPHNLSNVIGFLSFNRDSG